MIRASESTALRLAAAIAGAAVVSPLGFGAAAQEVKTATVRPECVNPTGAWISTCALMKVDQEIAETRKRTEQSRREGDQSIVARDCANFLRDNMGKTFTKEQLMAWLGSPKSREEFHARMGEKACGIAKSQGYTGRTAQIEAQP